MTDNRRQAELRGTGVPVTDTFQFGGPVLPPPGSTSFVPATVDFAVRWDAVGPAEVLGSGASAPNPSDPSAFLGRFRPARAVGTFSGSELGFRFQSNPGASSDQGYAELGTERNGSFL